jgi:hypothetical protein
MKQIFDEIMKELTDKEKEIMVQTLELNFILKKEIGKITKTKGLKKIEQTKRVIKRMKKHIKNAHSNIVPSHEDIIFHAILEANKHLTNIFSIDPQIIKLISKEKEVEEDEVKKRFDVKNIEIIEEFKNEELFKEIRANDVRVSNLLMKLIKHNSTVINNDNLKIALDRTAAKIEINVNMQLENEKLIKIHNELQYILRNIAVADIGITNLKTKYNTKELISLKYVITRFKNLIKITENLLLEYDIKYKYPKYSKLIIDSFEIEGERLTHDNYLSYVEYLVWLDGKGRLVEETELIRQWRDK